MDRKGEMAMPNSSSPYRQRERAGSGSGSESESSSGAGSTTGLGSRPAPQRGCIVELDVWPSSSSRGVRLESALGVAILKPRELVESPDPVSFAPPIGASFSAPTLGETARRPRGRPPKPKNGPGGSGSSLMPTRWLGRQLNYGHGRGSGRGGGLLSGSAAGPGIGLTTHLIVVNAAEDIAAKILAFAQQLQRVVCVLSGTGSVSMVTLSVPTTSGSRESVTYEILCLSGSFLPTTDGGSSNRNGGLSISFSRSDGSVSGGRVEKRLIAANCVQVILGSFEWNNQEGQEVGTSSGQQQTPENPVAPTTGPLKLEPSSVAPPSS